MGSVTGLGQVALWWAVHLVLAADLNSVLGPVVGPVVNPLEGEEVTALERQWLPSGRHIGAVADLWFLPTLNLEVSGAGIDLFDPVTLSAHGRASSQMRFFLGAQDLSDPGRSGQPLFDLPHHVWRTLRLTSLWTDRPGFVWDLGWKAPTEPHVSAAISYGEPADGLGAWYPAHVFDRDPGYAYGVPKRPRALQKAREVRAEIALNSALGPSYVTFEHIDHSHRYLTLTPLEPAERTTVLAWHKLALPWPLTWTAGWQQRRRRYGGAQNRLPESETHDSQAQAALAQLSSQGLWPGVGTVDLTLAGSWRYDSDRRHGSGPLVTDILNEWLWLARPEWQETLGRWRLGTQGELALEALPLRFLARTDWSELRATRAPYDGRVVTTYGGQEIRELRYDPVGVGRMAWQRARLEAHYTPKWGPTELRWLVALDHDGMKARGGPSLRLTAPAAGLAARWRSGQGSGQGFGQDSGAIELFALVRQEPEPLTAAVGRFINPAEPSGSIYARSFDLESAELAAANAAEVGSAADVTSVQPLGPLLSHTGGGYHGLGADLRRPLNRQLAFGGTTPKFGPFRLVLTVVGRWLVDRWTVRQAGPQSWSPVILRDPGGDGRGETPARGAQGQVLTVYNRSPKVWGQERYVLANDSTAALYGGVEFNLLSERHRRWFFNLGGAAYMSAGRAPFGNGFDRNDPGSLDESSADANQSVHSYGRYDHDRSFSLKLLTGFFPLESLSVALVARYRDGRPFARMLAAPNLVQGPTAVMAVGRGAPRDTFHMTFDTRIRWQPVLGPWSLAIMGDVFNVLGSSTEIIEDVRTGPSFRRALEGVVGRTFLLSLELGWQPQAA